VNGHHQPQPTHFAPCIAHCSAAAGLQKP
jgi:hypothetical protein